MSLFLLLIKPGFRVYEPFRASDPAGNKVSVSCLNWDMRTALHVAVSNGHGTIVEKLPGRIGPFA